MLWGVTFIQNCPSGINILKFPRSHLPSDGGGGGSGGVGGVGGGGGGMNHFLLKQPKHLEKGFINLV